MPTSAMGDDDTPRVETPGWLRCARMMFGEDYPRSPPVAVVSSPEEAFFKIGFAFGVAFVKEILRFRFTGGLR